jgi:hypothetical protein
MTRLLFFISIFSCLSFFGVMGQTPAYVATRTTEEIPWEQYSVAGKRFIIAGEAHQVSCNFSFQLSHLQYLVTKGFRNLVWEMPYSYTIIGQQYISTGADSLLRFIAWSEEGLSYWKSLYELNQRLPEGDKLHLWGIDLEIGDNIDGGAFRTKLFKKALEMLREGKGHIPPSLQQEFLCLDTATTVKEVIDIKHRLQKIDHHPEVAAFFGDRLYDFQILVNRLDKYKVLRNDEMLEAFKEICSLFQLDSSAKFLGRFGWGHTSKSFKKSMAWLLENDPSSPVKNSTYVIGVQYLDCTTWKSDKQIVLENYGIVNNHQQKQQLDALNRRDPVAIKIFSWPADEKLKGWAKEADVLFVFSGFPAIKPWKQP